MQQSICVYFVRVTFKKREWTILLQTPWLPSPFWSLYQNVCLGLIWLLIYFPNFEYKTMRKILSALDPPGPKIHSLNQWNWAELGRTLQTHHVDQWKVKNIYKYPSPTAVASGIIHYKSLMGVWGIRHWFSSSRFMGGNRREGENESYMTIALGLPEPHVDEDHWVWNFSWRVLIKTK